MTAAVLAVTLRRQHILTGAIAMVLISGAITVGIKGAFGAFDGGYELVGTFDAAGQGLLPGSDVKVRGVNIGEVEGIELRDGAARVTLRIDDGEQVPADASAVIRPKTLFGEKFVDIDPGQGEVDGPFLADGDEIANTLGGFELEEVLSDTYPILQAIDPAELTTVLSELAEAGDGLGETINRSIVNGDELAQVFADNAGNTEAFLRDLALVSDQLADDADALLALADAANEALPTLNAGEDDLIRLLQQTGRLSNDVADLLEGNEPFVDAVLTEGSRTLQLLYDERDQVVPLAIGLRQYLQSLAEVIRIDAGDGTLMAAVKAILGTEACAALPCLGSGTSSAAAPAAPSATAPPTSPALPVPDELTDAVDEVESGLSDLLTRILVG